MRNARRHRFIASLATLVLIGELLAIGVHGTLAQYTSQGTNKTANTSSGTLTLATMSTASTGKMCLSSGGPVGSPITNGNTACGAITFTGGPFYPGTTQTIRLRLENTGSLNAGDLALYEPACSGTLCAQLQFEVQETTSTGAVVRCFFPTTSTTCAFTATYTLTKFRSLHNSVAKRLALTGGLPALNSRFFTLGLEFPTYANPASGNTYEGKTAKFTLTWYLNQTGP